MSTTAPNENPDSGAPDPNAKPNLGTGPTRPSDAEAKLLKEVMTFKTKLKAVETEHAKFTGIDPEQARAVLARQGEIAAQTRAIEHQRLIDAGDWDGMRARLAGEHAAEKRAIESTITDRESQIAGLTNAIHELTIGDAFARSMFFRTETMLPPSKARRVYEANCELGSDGIIRVFDAPLGAPNREPLVNGNGEPLPFDEAMKRIVEADPDKDHLLRAKSRAAPKKSPSPEITGSGMGRIAAILKQGAETLDTTPPPPNPATARPGTERIDAILKAQAFHRAPKPFL
jgi:hypothetical protein